MKKLPEILGAETKLLFFYPIWCRKTKFETADLVK
jgi:hypothetical protein